MCVRVCVYGCIYVCVCVCVCMGVSMCVCVCVCVTDTECLYMHERERVMGVYGDVPSRIAICLGDYPN